MKVGLILPMGDETQAGVPQRWSETKALAVAAEEAGLDSVWVYDHLLSDGPEQASESPWEAWTLLSALAAVTDRGEVPDTLPRYQALRHDRVARAIAAANANAVNYHLAGARRVAAQAALAALGRIAPGLFLSRLDWLYGHDVTAAVP